MFKLFFILCTCLLLASVIGCTIYEEPAYYPDYVYYDGYYGYWHSGIFVRAEPYHHYWYHGNHYYYHRGGVVRGHRR